MKYRRICLLMIVLNQRFQYQVGNARQAQGV